MRRTREELSGLGLRERGLGGECGGRSAEDHVAAEAPGAGAEVDDVIGGADRLLVVLDDEHRVAEIAQALERAEQALVVARCRPIDGSSSTYITPESSLPSWLARRMRWASPPESVVPRGRA
jgi:hypothetical protein